MMEGMADFSEILASCDDCNEEDREWLHHLVADWQVIADLSFADLLLLLRTGEGEFTVAEQCRPSTVMSLRTEDVVGEHFPADQRGELEAAMQSKGVLRSTKLPTIGRATVSAVYAPTRPPGRTLGLVVLASNFATSASNVRSAR